ncbi:MAG: hypothetical protein KA419_00100 [Acidobacteria bacterium]|nr:hypothetical protein [Acidobacteriota bacterium]
MLTKLTLSLDDTVIAKAKEYARRRKKSLSRVIEDFLRVSVSADSPSAGTTPIVAELSGVISRESADAGERDYSDHLVRKYR